VRIAYYLATALLYDLRSHNPINHISTATFFYILQYAHSVKLILASISPARSRAKSDAAATLASDFLLRASRFLPCQAQAHSSEDALFAWMDRQSARTAPFLILLDSRGRQLTSEAFAAQIGRLRDRGTQTLVLAIGPADGWSDAARARAGLLLSFGSITLPHQLARVVLAEQIYRALTILAGHPYHSGH
jgi:23S rRNA (pseudouridine1915-N3)-methyltransferase